MAGYIVIDSGPGLWTVGFHKPDGEWVPASDHTSEREAKRQAWRLNGIESRYVHIASQPGLWTVGEYQGDTWEPDSDWDTETEAMDQVITLNA